MKSDFFIDRPIFSTVVSIVIVLVGMIGLFLLPVDQYPEIVPPVVQVSASYPGADAETVSQAVATPIEQELNGTPGMLYMESQSTNSGSFTVTITFDIDTDPDLAAVEIQNRVKQAEARLPAEVIQNGISVDKQASNKLMTITLLSNDPKFDEVYLSNYATLNVLDMLRRIPGVGRVSNVGSRYYGMQIWVQPERLASLGLTVQDIQSALREQNRESAAGVLGQQPMNGVDVTVPIVAQGRLSTVSEFEDIVLRANPDGSIIRMRDVARVSLEAQSYNTESGINGGNAAVMDIRMLPGMNAMEVSESVKKAMDEISRNFPEGISYMIPFDMTEYISQSIHEVYKTLFEALFLVILVVFLSLQSWRATLIPAIAVPISLIGTFGVMLIFGFSLNTLTLLGLVLAIGTVVDDAIVVVENRGETLGIRSHQESHERTGQRPDSHVAGTLRRVHPGELPLRHHRRPLPPVHHNHRGIRDYLHHSGPDHEPRDVRPVPQAQEGGRGGAQELHIPRYQPLARQGTDRLRPHHTQLPGSLQTLLRSLRHRHRLHLGHGSDRAPELPAAGGPGIFHRRVRAA